MKISNNNEFTEAMRDTVLAGEGFTPFVGSGCSALSGIPMGLEFSSYLEHVVLKCIDATAPWDLRKRGWPAYPTSEEKAVNRVMLENLVSLALGESENRQILVKAAATSFSHWTQTLHFLSRVSIDQDSCKPKLGAAYHPEVLVDQFHSHITEGRKPNFIHLMLCHLSGPARIRVHLTTNFDNLLETAFEEMGEDLSVYSISLFGGLPHPSLVHSRNTIIKLHGSRFETRANITLDIAPDERDLDRVYHYVRGCYPYSIHLENKSDVSSSFMPSNLLVCGYSGWDERCNLMIRRTLDEHSTNPGKVFWICFSRSDAKRIEQIFSTKELERVVVTSTERLDLLLYEFYQRLVLCLPRGGLTFQSTHSVPPENGFFTDPKVADDDAVLKGLEDQRDKGADFNRRSTLVIPTHDHGMQKPLRRLFNEFPGISPVRKIWLELEDFQDAASVAQTFLQIVAIRTGRFQVDHSILVPTSLSRGSSEDEWRAHLSVLVKYLAIDPCQWLFVLYARYGPGACAGWGEFEIWPDDTSLQLFIKALHECGFNVIYCPYDEDVRQKYDRGRAEQIDLTINQFAVERRLTPTNTSADLVQRAFCISQKHIAKAAIPIESQYHEPTGNWDRLAEVLRDISDEAGKEMRGANGQWRDDSFWRIVFGITLFRQSRRYSAFLSEGVICCPSHFNCNAFDNDVERMFKLDRVLGFLDKHGLIFRKPGGFAWMYKDARVALRVALERLDAGGLGLNLRANRAEQHFWIADWYMKSFYASGHADPLVEALFHYRMCSLWSGEANDDRKAYFWCAGVSQMARALDIGHSALQFWLGGPRLHALFEKVDFETDGHPLKDLANERVLIKQLVQFQPADELFRALKAHWLSIQSSSEDRAGRERFRSIEQFTVLSAHRMVVRNSHTKYLESLDELPSDDVKGLPRELLDHVFKHHQTGEDLFDALRQTMFHSIFMPNQDFGMLAETMQLLGEWSYVLLRKAKRLEAINFDDGVIRSVWLSVCLFARATIAHCFVCHPALTAIEWKQRVMVLSDYGLALAKLKRFRESHRRLNEAHGILSKMEAVSTSVLAGIVELRKAESTLLETVFLRARLAEDSQPLQYFNLNNPHESPGERDQRLDRLSIARCDDAWVRLEIARQHLTGRTHSAHWWLVVYVLEMECVTEGIKQEKRVVGYSSLVNRVAQEPHERLERLLVKALAMAADDDFYNRLRALETYRDAVEEILVNPMASTTAISEIERIGKKIPRHAYDFTNTYYKKVAAKF